MGETMSRRHGIALSRRGVLMALSGLTAVSAVGRSARAQLFARARDESPVFRTAKGQFTLLRPERELPPVSVTDLNGRPARLAPSPGKVLLIDFWATWCEACRVDLPLLERFHKVMAGRVEIAAVTIEAIERQQVKSFLTKLSIRDLPIYLDPNGRLASSSPESAAPLKLYGMPLTYLVTPSGRIAGYIAGGADWLAEDGQKLLAYYAAA